MVKHLFSILFALAAVFCSTMPVWGDTPPGKQHVIPIKHVETGSTVRDLNIPPLHACYNGTSSTIYTTITSDLGQIEMTVVNLSTGEVWSDILDSGALMQTALQISGTPGYYTITYTTESGRVYEGYFTLN